MPVSGENPPVGNLPGWTQTFVDDFDTDVPVGSFPGAAYGSRWSVYPDGWHDTSGNGTYMPSQVLSVAGSTLDYYIHTNGSGVHCVAAPLPNRGKGQLYGRYALRFRSDSLYGYKIAWLPWPDSGQWPANGEIDFPELNLDATIKGFMHRMYGTSGGDQDSFTTGQDATGWHTCVIEWEPGSLTFDLDDGAHRQTFTDRVPSTSMHWVLQAETNLDGTETPNNTTAGHIQVDWVAAWAYAGGSSDTTPAPTLPPTTTPAPVITAITPSSGPAGTHVVVSGTGLAGTTAVHMGGIVAPFAVVNDIALDVTIPVNAATGTITLATPGGTATTGTFTVGTSSGLLTVGDATGNTSGATAIGGVTLGQPGLLAGPTEAALTSASFDGTGAIMGPVLTTRPTASLSIGLVFETGQGGTLAAISGSGLDSHVLYLDVRGHLVFAPDPAHNTAYVATAHTYADGRPHYALVSSVAGAVTIEVDGIVVARGTAAFDPSVATTPGAWTLGAAVALPAAFPQTGTTRGFVGKMQEFAVYAGPPTSGGTTQQYIDGSGGAPAAPSGATTAPVPAPAPAPAARTIVAGNVGGAPADGFTFDGNWAQGAAYDQATTARIDMSSAVITPDMSAMVQEVGFIGGDSDADFPANGTITGLTLLRPTAQSYQWRASLPVISLKIGDTGGYLAYTPGDGKFYPYVKCVSAPHLCLAQDTVASVLYIGTPHGVYTRISDPMSPNDWAPLGGLDGEVTRLQLVYDTDGSPVLFALVKNTKGLDGVYRYPALSGTVTGQGYDGWTQVVLGEIVDMVASDAYTCWTVLGAHQGGIFRHIVGNANAVTFYGLPSGTKATRLDRVTIAADAGDSSLVPPRPASPASDSIWALTTGDDYGCYWMSTAGSALAPSNLDHSLVGPAGQALTVNHVVGSGLVILGRYCAALACTNNGLYASSAPYAAPSGGSGQTQWFSLNGQNGLYGSPVGTVAAGLPQPLMDGQFVQRFYATNDSHFFMSSSACEYWRDENHEKLRLGPYLTALVYKQTGDYPSNDVVSIGPDATAPNCPAAGAHVQIPGLLPGGWYYYRFLDEQGNWAYRLYNSNAPFPTLVYSQLADLQTNESVPLLTAAVNLAQVHVRYLGEHQRGQVILELESFFDDDGAGLRRLRPTHLVAVNYTGQMAMRRWDAGSGGYVIDTTTYVDMVGQEWYVLAHSITGTGGPYARTKTTLGLEMAVGDTPEDTAASNTDAIKNIQAFSRR